MYVYVNHLGLVCELGVRN